MENKEKLEKRERRRDDKGAKMKKDKNKWKENGYKRETEKW